MLLLQLGDALAGAELGQPGPVAGGEGGVVLSAHPVHQVGGVLDVAQAEHVTEFVHDDGPDNLGSCRVLECFF
jgi:hypothetical protein